MGSINDASAAEWDLAAKQHHHSSGVQTYKSVHADPVNKPEHYNAGEIETIDYIVDVLGAYEAISYCHGNLIKYTGSRLWTKGNPIQDAEKAEWYLKKMIELMKQTKGVNW
jgi:hypothetical protein